MLESSSHCSITFLVAVIDRGIDHIDTVTRDAIQNGIEQLEVIKFGGGSLIGTQTDGRKEKSVIIRGSEMIVGHYLRKKLKELRFEK